jgi:DNA-binding MarR family transcriptional regulator
MDKSLSPSHAATLARLSVAFLTWRRHLQRNLVPYGITLKQQFVLRQLAEKDFLNPSDIAEMLFCDRPTATVILDNLAKQGWIRRDRGVENRKFVRVSITPLGRQKLAALDAAHWQDFDPLVVFSEEELQQFDSLLRKLKTYIDEVERSAGLAEAN